MIHFFVSWLALAALTADFDVVSTDSVIRLRRGAGALRLIFRNNSPVSFSQLKLVTQTVEGLDLAIQPSSIMHCRPAQRCVFLVQANAQSDLGEERFFISTKLVDGHKNELYQMRLGVMPNYRDGREKWMDAGTINITGGTKGSKLAILVMLGLLPVLLLLVLGRIFKRKAQRPD